MSTRINPDFYGAENTFIQLSSTQYAKRCASNIGQLTSSGTYTGGSFDTSAAPWGVGASSISSDFFFIATKGAEWTITTGGNTRQNTPLYLYWNSDTIGGGNDTSDLVGSSANSYYYARALYKNRLSPEIEVSSNQVISTLSLDDTTSVDLQYTTGQFPVTYANYQNLRILIGDIYYKPKNSTNINRTSMSAIQSGSVDVDKIVEIRFSIYDTNNANTHLQLSIGGSELDIPEIFKNCYYEDLDKWVRPWRRISSCGYWYYDPDYLSTYFYYFNTDTAVVYTSSYESPSSDDIPTGRPGSNAWGHMSDKQQVFDDVSYHWKYGLSTYASSQWDLNEIKTGDTYESGLYRSFGYMELDDPSGNLNESYFNAIIHELAFLGLPIVADSSHISDAIGSNYVYLPVFDEHLVTTGDFLSGAQSLNLPNAEWTDIFGSDMPEYDPDYEPEPPEPGEDDRGDLSNEYPHRFTNAGGLAQYVVDQGILLQLAAFLNGSYLPTAADLEADFKGTNPMDYIVSVQKYPFSLPNVGTSSDIYIGKNNTSLQGKKLFPDIGGLTPLPINSDSTFDFGSISIPYYFNDFRDYQSKIFLFMPFIGTDELDPRLYIGHALSLVYRVDYNTGSVIAEIKRDGLTMETKNGTISITVPFLAANMGAYQNQLAQLSYSKDMTKIKGIGTALSAGFTMAAGASGTLSSGQFPLAAASNLAQSGVQLAANATQLSQLDYQIEHTAPQLGTISTAGAATAFFMDDRARIIIARPKMLPGYNPTSYSHTIGNACCKTGTLSAFSGFTQAATAILDDVHTKHSSRQATEQERQLLRRALQNGIYL
mgnify:CR=1 FL=1